MRLEPPTTDAAALLTYLVAREAETLAHVRDIFWDLAARAGHLVDPSQERVNNVPVLIEVVHLDDGRLAFSWNRSAGGSFEQHIVHRQVRDVAGMLLGWLRWCRTADREEPC
jgi:hypothetical protein